MSDIGFFRLLEALSNGCPICQIIREGIINSMDAILYEHVNDPVIRKQLRTGWLCNRHAWELRSRGDAFGQSIIYEDLLTNLIGYIDEAGKRETRKGFKGPWGLREPGERCMFCISEKEIEERFISIFIENFHDKQFQTTYKKSPGLCLPHLIKVIRKGVNSGVVQSVLSIERKKISQLVGELREFIRKHDYRYSEEPFGKERDAWIRAVEKLNGKAGIL
jgi:hypothetical protein